MPLPVRTTSVPTKPTDTKNITVRSYQAPKATVKSKQDFDTENQKPVEIDDDEKPSLVSLVHSSGTDQSSSRIPSPFKQNIPDQPTPIHQARIQQILPNRGHLRQRSNIVPPAAPPQRPGHARSISTISTKATAIHGNDTRKPALKPAPSIARQLTAPAKSKLGVTRSLSAATVVTSRTQPLDSHQELLRNELLQLSIVYKASAETLQAYQDNIEHILATHQREVTAQQAIVLRKKLASSAVINACALDAWLQRDGYQNTCRSIQDLSVAVRNLHDLEQIFSNENGLAAAFGEWYRNITGPKDSRTPIEIDPSHVTLHLDYEENLSPQLQRFKQQTDYVVASLQNLPPYSDTSSLCSILRDHILLAESLQSQCQIMLQVGGLVVEDHHKWLREEVMTAVDERKGSVEPTSWVITAPIWET